jgi:quercetin dioxygenase-like cupin family protein
MVEKLYKLTQGEDLVIEKVLHKEKVHFNHMILPKGDKLPLHNANAEVLMTVVRGTVSLKLDDQEVHKYPAGSLLSIPFDTKMDVRNLDEETVELIVVKYPSIDKNTI